MSTPVSMTVSGLPGPGALARSAPTAGIHHSGGAAAARRASRAARSARELRDEAVANEARKRRCNAARLGTARRAARRDLDSARATEGAARRPAVRRRDRVVAAELAGLVARQSRRPTPSRPATSARSREHEDDPETPQGSEHSTSHGTQLSSVSARISAIARPICRRAIELLAAEDGIEASAVSELRETEPVGPVDQGPFLNGAVARRDRASSARAARSRLLAIEQRSAESAASASARERSISTCSCTETRSWRSPV